MRHDAGLFMGALFTLALATACSGDEGGAAGAGGTAGSAGNGGTAGVAGGAGSAGTAGSAGSAGAPWMGVYTVDLELPAPSTPPIDVGSLNVKFYRDVPYGTDPRTRFDIFVPESATPAPVMIHIHGGGFVGGSKDGYAGDAANINKMLTQNVAYASIEYRLLDDVDTVGVIKPLSDCRRALQFIRHHAAAFNLEPSKVVLEGGSAGAGTSLWIAFHDDMAASATSDPVAQQSTRVLGAAANATQATYDLVKWDTVVFAEFGISFLDAAVAQGLGPRLMSFYGISSMDQLESAEIQSYRAEVDMLGSMSADDPPFYVNNPLANAGIPTTENGLFHHAYHARALTQQADSTGLSYVAYIAALGVADPSGNDEWDFALQLLTP